MEDLNKLNIIPIEQNGKRPLIRWKKYINKKYPKNKLKEFKPCNYGVVCGRASNNLVIFDLDYKDNNKKYFSRIFQKFYETYPQLATTFITETPHGHHFWYYIKDRCPTRSPHQDSQKSKILEKLANHKNPFLIKVTNFPNLLKGVDILGQNGYALIPPSKIDGVEYRAMNNKEVKVISNVVFEKIKEFFLMESPTRRQMRTPFFLLLMGDVDIEDQSQSTGKEEFLYWKYLFLEAFHNLDLKPEDLFHFLKLNQPAFNEEKTRIQLQYVDFSKNPMTNEKMFELFPSHSTTIINEREDSDDPDYVKIGEKLKERYQLLTMDDSGEILIKRGNVCSNDIKEMEEELAEEIRIRRKSITHLSNQVLKWIRLTTKFSRENFCYDEWLINFKNGYYDLKKDAFFPHEEFKDKLFCYEIPHEYEDGEFDCPKFKKALSEWLGRDNKVTQNDIFEMIGYTMTMNTDMKTAFFIFGPSHSGKTQFQTVLEHVIGHQNRANISLQRMSKDHFGTHGLAFKILNMVGDMSYLQINDVSAFKTLTGGDEYVQAEIKGGTSYQFKNICKIWYSANDIPILERDDQAFYNRWMLIEFPNEFPMHDDHTIKKIGKIIGEDSEEIKGIIYESINGLKRLMNRRWFRRGLMSNTRHTWKYHSEPIYGFLHDKCIRGKDGYIECIEFRDALNTYFYKRGLPPLSSYKLTQQLERYNIYRVRSTTEIDSIRPYVYVGIRWKAHLSDFS